MLLFSPLPAKGKYLFLSAFFVLSLLWRPVDVLIIRAAPVSREDASFSGQPVFRAGVPLGQEFWTQYLHSVQLTPVLDCYRIVNGRIWSWREYTQSHNAGLPFQKPAFGRVIMDAPWMILEGGRQSWERIALRVGDAELGRNAFACGRGMPAVWTPLYERHAGKRLLIEVAKLPLLYAAGLTAN